nr:uncharacterized protein LOC106618722 [Bactrocera oleae]
MSMPFCQCKLRNEWEHAYGHANSYNRRPHEDPDYLDQHAWDFIRTFSDQTHKNYLLARHLKATSNGQWKTLQWLMQGDLDAILDTRLAKKTSGKGAETAKSHASQDKVDKNYLSARHLKTTTHGQRKSLQELMHGDRDALLDKHIANRTYGTGANTATAYASQKSVDKSRYVPLTNYFGPENIKRLISQKHGSQHVLDFAVNKDEKQDHFHASQFKQKEVKTVKRGLGFTTGFPRIDKDLERAGGRRYLTEIKFQRSKQKNQMKNFIKTMNQFYADVTDPQPMDVDSVELMQALEEEFYKTYSYMSMRPSNSEEEQTKLRLSAVVRMLKSMPGYEAFERVLYHEPFDRDRPWTFMRTFPKRIPKEYLNRVSQHIVSDMKTWKRQQKIIALTYSPSKQVTDTARRLQKKRGRKNLKSQNPKEPLDDDDY